MFVHPITTAEFSVPVETPKQNKAYNYAEYVHLNPRAQDKSRLCQVSDLFLQLSLFVQIHGLSS